MTTKGAILPAGSTLVQFEIERYADGFVDTHLPCPVWVDRENTLKPSINRDGIACGCNGPFYPIRMFPEGREAVTVPGHTASVCLCMGRFIE
jgi:hypothetical protein